MACASWMNHWPVESLLLEIHSRYISFEVLLFTGIVCPRAGTLGVCQAHKYKVCLIRGVYRRQMKLTLLHTGIAYVSGRVTFASLHKATLLLFSPFRFVS